MQRGEDEVGWLRMGREANGSLNTRLGTLAITAALVACVVASAGCAGSESTSQVAPKPTAGTVLRAGLRAPDFTARDLNGRSVTLSAHLGKDVVLLDFCSTWCEPCIAEFPHLRALYQAHKEKGLVILAVSVDGPDTIGDVPGFARRNQLPFPVLLDERANIAALYNPKRAAPVTVLIDRSGTITAVREGYTSGDEVALANDVTSALQATASR